MDKASDYIHPHISPSFTGHAKAIIESKSKGERYDLCVSSCNLYYSGMIDHAAYACLCELSSKIDFIENLKKIL